MKKLFITDLKIGDSIFGEVFAVKSYVKKASRNNKPYIDIELADCTGCIKGKIWSDDFSACENVEDGDVIEINGTIDDFNGPQLRITNLKRTEKYEMGDLQPKTNFDIEKMWADIEKTTESIKNPHLKGLLKNIFDSEMIERFKTAPAGFKVHHAYVGGLLEHTWEMLKMTEGIKSHFPKLNLDIINTGVILHDIGKVRELEIGTAIQHTDEGKLLGHIYLGASLVEDSAPKDMPQDLLLEIIHIILSHHGELQFGSPVAPKTAEAIAVNSLDRTSSQMNLAYGHIHSNLGKEKYTQYVSQLGTELYRSPYVDDLNNEDIPF